MSVKAVELKPGIIFPRGPRTNGSEWRASSSSSRGAVAYNFALQIQCILCEYKSLSTPELSVGFNWSHNFTQAQGGNLS